MNRIYILGILSLITLFNISCEDSFGIEKNYTKRLISDDTIITPPPLQKLVIFKNIEYKFYEFYKLRPIGRDTLVAFMIPWNIDKYSIKAKMDTSNSNWAIWLDMKFANSLPDRAYINRNDRIIALKILVDSLTFDPSLSATKQEYLLNGDLTSGRWSQLLYRVVSENDTIMFSHYTSRVRISIYQSIQLVRDMNGTLLTQRYIEANIWSDLPKQSNLQTFRLEGIVRFYLD